MTVQSRYRKENSTFASILLKYINCGKFSFASLEVLKDVCTAPKNAAGVYLVEGLLNSENQIIYIGHSGKIQQDGKISIREGGLYDRIVNGRQFNGKRCKTWPLKMNEQNIKRLNVFWYETINNDIKDIPAYIEAALIQKYFEMFNKLPKWNQLF